MPPYIDTSSASEAVRPKLEKMLACIKISLGDDIGHELAPEMETPAIIVQIDRGIASRLRKIGRSHDASAVPILLDMLTMYGNEPYLNWKKIYHGYLETLPENLYVPGRNHPTFSHRLCSPRMWTIKHNVIAAIQEIVEHSPEARNYNLTDYLKI